MDTGTAGLIKLLLLNTVVLDLPCSTTPGFCCQLVESWFEELTRSLNCLYCIFTWVLNGTTCGIDLALSIGVDGVWVICRIGYSKATFAGGAGFRYPNG